MRKDIISFPAVDAVLVAIGRMVQPSSSDDYQSIPLQGRRFTREDSLLSLPDLLAVKAKVLRLVLQYDCMSI